MLRFSASARSAADLATAMQLRGESITPSPSCSLRLHFQPRFEAVRGFNSDYFGAGATGFLTPSSAPLSGFQLIRAAGGWPCGMLDFPTGVLVRRWRKPGCMKALTAALSSGVLRWAQYLMPVKSSRRQRGCHCLSAPASLSTY